MSTETHPKPPPPRAWSNLLNGVMFIVVGLVFCVGVPVLMLSLSAAGPTPQAALSPTHLVNGLLAFAFGAVALVIGVRLIRKSLGGGGGDRPPLLEQEERAGGADHVGRP
jgi:sugar phosphate permease